MPFTTIADSALSTLKAVATSPVQNLVSKVSVPDFLDSATKAISSSAPNLGLGTTGPLFSTGEPRREYEFQFKLILTSSISDDEKHPFQGIKELFSTASLSYVSGLAEQVNLASSKFILGDSVMSSLAIPFPKGFEIPTFSVQYLEDENEFIYHFHHKWQQAIKGIYKGIREDTTYRATDSSGNEVFNREVKSEFKVDSDVNINGLQFEPIGNVCLKAIYSPTKKVYTPSLFVTSPVTITRPLGSEVFPYIFPIEVQRSAPNKSGQNIMKTTVVYARLVDTSTWGKCYRTGYEHSVLVNNGTSALPGVTRQPPIDKDYYRCFRQGVFVINEPLPNGVSVGGSNHVTFSTGASANVSKDVASALGETFLTTFRSFLVWVCGWIKTDSELEADFLDYHSARHRIPSPVYKSVLESHDFFWCSGGSSLMPGSITYTGAVRDRERYVHYFIEECPSHRSTQEGAILQRDSSNKKWVKRGSSWSFESFRNGF